MDITSHPSLLPDDDPGACVAGCRGTRGLGVRSDAGSGGLRRATAGAAGRPRAAAAGLPIPR
jgi:hypothetical protein